MLFALLLLTSQVNPLPQTAYRLIHSRTGQEITLAQLADDCGTRCRVLRRTP